MGELCGTGATCAWIGPAAAGWETLELAGWLDASAGVCEAELNALLPVPSTVGGTFPAPGDPEAGNTVPSCKLARLGWAAVGCAGLLAA